MSMKVSVRLVFVTEPEAVYDSFLDISVWNVAHDKTPCEFKNVSRMGKHLTESEAANMGNLLSSGCVCIMCSMDNHRRTVGSTLFTAAHVCKRIAEQKPLLIRHPVNSKCVALVSFSSSKLIGHVVEDLETIQLINQCNMLSQKIAGNAVQQSNKLADSMHYAEAFFPAESAGKSFQNLLTVMPCTVMQPDLENQDDVREMIKGMPHRIYLPMPLLERALEAQNSVVPLEWLGYNVYGACLLMNVNPNQFNDKTNLCSEDVHWPEFFEALITLVTCDPSFNVYFSDLVPVSVTQGVTIKNRREFMYEWEPSESIQRPLSKEKIAPDDCEDWAMLLKMMSMAASYHNKRTQNFETLANQLHKCRLLEKLSKQSIEGIAAIIMHLAWAVDKNKMVVNMSCGIAGAPSLSKQSAGGQPGGHEFCFLYTDQPCPGEETCYTSILEGTNWTKSTHLPMSVVNQLNLRCVQVAKAIKLNPVLVRPRGVQHVGSEKSSVLEAFWRTIIGLGGNVLISTRDSSEENAECATQWGANVGRLLSYFECGGANKSVKFFPMGEILGEDMQHVYEKAIRKIFDMVNLPKMQWWEFTDLVSKDWKPAQEFDSLPQSFLERNGKHHNFFFHPEQSKPEAHGAPFMTGYLYYAGLPDEPTAAVQ